MLKMENNQFVRELVDRWNPEEVNTYNEHQKQLGNLDNIFACISGKGIAAERFIKPLTPEIERREKIEQAILEKMCNPELTIEKLSVFNSDYSTEQLEKFYDYYIKNMTEGVVVLDEFISDPRIKWGTDKSLEEALEFEKYIEENAASLPGLPQDIKLIPGDCVGISAPTGSGKSTALVGIAIKELNLGKKVILLALEETEVEIRLRIIKGLHDRSFNKNLGIVEVKDFKESTFRKDFTNLLNGSAADVVLIDYINDNFMLFDQNRGLQAYEKIKKTVAEIADINHKTLKTILVIGVQGTSGLLTANKKKILEMGKSFFEGGQSTIKPLQYAIIIKEADEEEDGSYEKMAFVVKQRNALVRTKNTLFIPTYGMNYNNDQYSFDLIGDLKTIVKALEGKKTTNSTSGSSTGGRK